jgi:hypothetical protein
VVKRADKEARFLLVRGGGQVGSTNAVHTINFHRRAWWDPLGPGLVFFRHATDACHAGEAGDNRVLSPGGNRAFPI